MIKNSKYLLITTFFSFLFCSGCLTDNLGDCYQHIGLESWLAKHVDAERAENVFRDTELKRYQNSDSILNNKKVTIEHLKNVVSARHKNLKTFESMRGSKIPKDSMNIESQEGEYIELSEHFKPELETFENEIRPHLKNPNQSEEEISHLRFQWLCEDTAYECEMFKKILKAKQEQEQE